MPPGTPRVEIVAIGEELLLGLTVDTNAAYLSRELAAIGIAVVRRTTCGDASEEIVAAVREALERTGAVITTGGLGPTADDRTKAAIAGLFQRELVLNEMVVDRLKALWTAYARPGELPRANYSQAMIPTGARILDNRHGTAPGVLLDDERGRWVAMLPGVPREMRGMYQDSLRPVLISTAFRDADSATLPVIRSRTLRTTGVAESVLAERLGVLGEGGDGVQVAFLPSRDGVDLRLTARGLPPDAAERALAQWGKKVLNRIGDACYTEGATDLAAVVVDLCRAQVVRLATAESCTGGLLGARITAISGASDVFQGGLVAYSNRVKHDWLGVSEDDLAMYGAVSEPVVRQMAAAVRECLGTEIGVGITGVAGPAGGTPEKPVGTVWIGIDVAPSVPSSRPSSHPLRQARLFRLVGDREEIRYRAAQAALEMLRRALLALPAAS